MLIDGERGRKKWSVMVSFLTLKLSPPPDCTLGIIKKAWRGRVYFQIVTILFLSNIQDETPTRTWRLHTSRLCGIVQSKYPKRACAERQEQQDHLWKWGHRPGIPRLAHRTLYEGLETEFWIALNYMAARQLAIFIDNIEGISKKHEYEVFHWAP